jgi:hypothetical protein
MLYNFRGETFSPGEIFLHSALSCAKYRTAECTTFQLQVMMSETHIISVISMAKGKKVNYHPQENKT